MKTIYLRQPVNLNIAVDDPNGQKDEKGNLKKVTVTKHFKRGSNVVDDAVAAHPYIRAHTKENPANDPGFTATQLREMLAEAEAREKAGDKTKVSVTRTGEGDKTPIEWPADDVIDGLNFAQLDELLTLHGIDAKPLGSKADRIAAAKKAKLEGATPAK